MADNNEDNIPIPLVRPKDPFRQGIPLGSTVSFRYALGNDKTPMVFLLTTNFNGKLHGLNLRYLSPLHLRQLQWLFLPPEQQQQVQDPYAEQIQQEQNQAQELAKQQALARKQEQLEKQTGVIVKPMRGQNSFGGINTFGKTQGQQIPARPGMPGIEGAKVLVPQMQPTQQQMELRLRYNIFRAQQEKRERLISNPYDLYHQFIKPMLGRNVANVYRTYDTAFVQNLRIVHSPIGML